MSDGKCIVKYLRLSLEDEDMLDESNSISFLPELIPYFILELVVANPLSF